MQVEKIFEHLGLNRNKAKVYLACLKLGPNTTQQIAQEAKLKRTTTYDIILDLIQKQFLTQTKQGNKRLFIAEKPATIQNIYQEKVNSFASTIPFLNSLLEENKKQPLIKYYQGKSEVKRILEEMLDCQEKVLYNWGSKKIIETVLGSIYIRSWTSRRVRKNIQGKTLRNKEEEVDKAYSTNQKKYLREIRFPKIKLLVGSNLTVYDEKVVFISSNREGFGFVVESQEFSQTIKNIFNTFWEVSQPSPNQ